MRNSGFPPKTKSRKKFRSKQPRKGQKEPSQRPAKNRIQNPACCPRWQYFNQARLVRETILHLFRQKHILVKKSFYETCSKICDALHFPLPHQLSRARWDIALSLVSIKIFEHNSMKTLYHVSLSLLKVPLPPSL